MKKTALTCALLCALLSTAFALTPAERKQLQEIQGYVRQGQIEYQQAMSAVGEADQRASLAEEHAATTDTAIENVRKDIKAAHDREVTLGKDNAKMKPVYDECVSKWGIGAILFGIKRLTRNLLITALVGAALVAILYGLSFAFPIFGVALAAVTRIFRTIFRALAATMHRLTLHLHPAANLSSWFTSAPPSNATPAPPPPPVVELLVAAPPPAAPPPPEPPAPTGPAA